MNGQKADRMKELVELLNRAGKAYYQDAEEMISNQIGRASCRERVLQVV